MNTPLETVIHDLIKSAFLAALHEHGPIAPRAAQSKTEANSLPPDRLLTIADVAEWLAVSQRQVHKLTHKEGLPCVKIGRLVRYAPDSVQAWIDDQAGPLPDRPTPPRRTEPRERVAKKHSAPVLKRDTPAPSATTKKAGNSKPKKATRQRARAVPTASSEEERRPSRLQLLAESLGVEYATLGPVTNGDVRRVMGVDVPTCHGWTYLNRDLPDEAMHRLREWLLSFKSQQSSGDANAEHTIE